MDRMTDTEPPDLDTLFSPAFWDERYSGHDHLFSGRPNVRLVENAGDLTPARALDLGCGEGADAVWLAERGWRVLACDVSQVAVDRAAQRAAGRQGADRITWQQTDARTWTPPATSFELASMHYLHLPRAFLPGLFAGLTHAVVPGGRLLFTAHDPRELEEGVPRWNVPDLFSTAAEIAELLDATSWDVEIAEVFPREAEHPDGTTGPITMWDTVVLAVRRSG